LKSCFSISGGTLIDRDPLTGKLTPFPSSSKLLHMVRDVIGARVGIITTLGPSMTNEQGRDLLQQFGLAEFIETQAFISEHDANESSKPNSEIYKVAAQRVGVSIEHCLYVGENLIEVIGALRAGMQSILKPYPPGRDLPD
jgi:FMN phosphatase YigB (HAD superfamily)